MREHALRAARRLGVSQPTITKSVRSLETELHVQLLARNAQGRIVEGLAHLLLPAVRDESLDFVMGMRHATELDPDIRFRPLYRSELVVAARKDHPLRHARSLAQLAGCEWISTSTLGLPGGPVERLFASRGLPPPRPVIVCEYYNTVVALLGNSDMMGLMQRRALNESPARECLQELHVAEEIPAVTAGIYTRANTPLTRAASAMAKAASAVARDLVDLT
jgi:LysR family transcriptional regulator, regulator of abg operon